MTPSERERVVELLLCAADRGLSRRWFWLVAGDLDASGAIVAFAESACEAVDSSARLGAQHELLEAAQRVNEGSWPKNRSAAC